MELTSYSKGFVNATNVLTSYSLDINAMTEFNKPADEYTSFVQHMLLSQTGFNKWINVFSQKGTNAVSKEMKQFHDR